MPWYGSHSFLTAHIRKSKCKRIMEIGVLNGENAVKMIEAAALNLSPGEVEYYGFDFFAGDLFRRVEHMLKKTGCRFRLFKGDTADTLPQVAGTLPKMDLIFIDGGKSYSEAKNDWQWSKTLMHDETTVFVHNYYFPGVQRMVDEIPQDKYHITVIHPSNDSDTAIIKEKTEHND